MTHISTLIADVQSLLKTKGWMTDALSKEFAHEVSIRLQTQYNDERTPRLRLSQMGPKCPCQLWHSIKHPELAEPLPPWAEFKYSYGHIIEAMAVTLAKAAGHEVTGEQDEVTVDSVTGHRDCIIDGCLVDVKSTSSYGYQKFLQGTIAFDDQFGYLDQLDGYLVGSADDPLLRTKDVAYLWAIEKQLGKMCLYEHRPTSDYRASIRGRISEYNNIVVQTTPPACICKSIADGKSGNMRLDIKASYNPYKWCCKPHLRAFVYSDGIRYLTKVVRQPDVKEVDRNGKIVYN